MTYNLNTYRADKTARWDTDTPEKWITQVKGGNWMASMDIVYTPKWKLIYYTPGPGRDNFKSMNVQIGAILNDNVHWTPSGTITKMKFGHKIK